MSTKEKAKELVDKYFIELNEHNECYEEAAIQCALIAVDELIEESYFTDGYYDRQDYWQEVKQEIINL